MRITSHKRGTRLLPLSALSALAFVFAGLFPVALPAQDEPSQEFAVHLAEGRVVICAAKDGLVVATLDPHSDPGAHPPSLVPFGPLRAAVILGAVDWRLPASDKGPVRLDSEFSSVAAAALATSSEYVNAASDIEAIGVAFLERLRQVTAQLTRKINLPEDEPLVRILLADYVPNYGPEAWTLDYHIKQEDLGNDYWRIRVLRPAYNQLYPPEKGQPHTFIETGYPQASRPSGAPELIDLLRQDDPRLAPIRASNEALAKSVGLVVAGESQKSIAEADADFLRAALPAIAGANAKMSLAVIDFDKGFRWLLEPPKAELPPTPATPQEPGAPTLRNKPTD